MTNVACALLGCYLVLRRMSLLGDAISHAVLPGLVVAFLLSGTVGLVGMMIGATVLGMFTTVATETLHRRGGVAQDASMGVVFTSLFALGVILIKRYSHAIDLDPDCVLNGALEMVEFNTIALAGHDVPRALVTITPVLLLNLLFILVLHKELLVGSFDPALAKSMGFRPGVIHYMLMVLVALTTVASFEQVGSILVIAMLIVPGATAHLLTDRLRPMLVIAVVVAVGSAVGGQLLAVRWNTNTAGTMTLVVGACFATAVVFSPRHGILVAMIRKLRMSWRIVSEDILAMLYRVEELAIENSLDVTETSAAVGGGMTARVAIWGLLASLQITRAGDGLRLTDTGRHRAARLLRGHRLWESYLVDRLGLPLDHVHEPAERMEHYLDDHLQRQLVEQVQQPDTDPHGRPIPKGPLGPFEK